MSIDLLLLYYLWCKTGTHRNIKPYNTDGVQSAEMISRTLRNNSLSHRSQLSYYPSVGCLESLVVAGSRKGVVG